MPAILEYVPYRKGDAFAVRDSRHHGWFAQHGYAGVRVDLRGSGDSDGILLDEYLPQEQDDALEVIAWLASQPWCSGAVGMLGISWGGFNGLQVAARRPPALKAVVSLCASDDRYADDVHYAGGCVLGVDMLQWAATMLTLCAMPPDPAAVGDGWRATWLERLDEIEPMVRPWLSHQRRDAYWRHGSVCEDYTAVEAPVYAVGGWSDGYSNAIPRLIEGLPGPRKGLIGPWSHAFPYDGAPGPAIGFLQECRRWFDHWLKGIDTGIMDEPALRIWMQEPVAPAAHHTERPGRWIAEPAWPPPSVTVQALPLPLEGAVRHRSPEGTGQDAGAWCPDGGDGDWPRRPAGRGRPVARAHRRAARRADGDPRLPGGHAGPRGRQAARARGRPPLRRRPRRRLPPRHARPAQPRPRRPPAARAGRRTTVRVKLDAIAQAVEPGHALRVAISTVYWPWAWPSPEPVTLTLHAATLHLPVRPPRDDEPGLPPFGPPESAEPLAAEVIEPGVTNRTYRHDLQTGVHEIHFEWDVGGRRRLVEAGTEMHDTNVTRNRIADGDPLSAEVRVRCTTALGRGAWQTRVETESRMTSTATDFLVTQRLDAYEDGERVRSRAWDLRIPRDGA